MPGLFGVINLPAWGDAERILDAMGNAMMHDPYYTSGVYRHESLRLCAGWVAHPESFSARMPAWNERGDVCLLFTGEEFSDHRDAERRSAGSGGSSGSEAAYIVQMYEQHGISFLERLNGWFSGLLIDLRNRNAVLFNDRYGLQRVYVHERGGAFYFASEAKALLKALPHLRTPDWQGLGETFALGCVLEDRTLFRDIALLPAGSAWVFSDASGPRKGTYFSPSSWENQHSLGEAEYIEALRETFARILPRYLRGDWGAVGMSLTGGLDGRMIMAWADAAEGLLPCYTFAGPYRECMDVRIARKIAGICGRSHQTITVGEQFLSEFPSLAEKAIYLSDGAMDITGAVELFVNHLARNIAPVRLTGNYGSEIVRGNVAFRPRVFPERLLDSDFYRHVIGASVTYRRQRQAHDVTFIAFRQVPWFHYARFSVEASQLTVRSPYLDNELVAMMYRAPRNLFRSPKPTMEAIATGKPALARVPTDRGLVGGETTMVSRAQGAYRAFTAKAEYVCDYGMPQWMAYLDHLFLPLRLERLFLGRHKFYHFRVWYRDRLSAYLREVLLDQKTLSRPYVNGQELRKIVGEHVHGVANHTSEIHRILTAELLHRQLLDSP